MERLSKIWDKKSELLRKHVWKQALQWLRREKRHQCHSLPSQSHRRRPCLQGFSYLPAPQPQAEGKDQGLCLRMGFGDWVLEAIADPEEWLNQSHHPKPQRLRIGNQMATPNPNPEKSGHLNPKLRGWKQWWSGGSGELENWAPRRCSMTAGRKAG